MSRSRFLNSLPAPQVVETALGPVAFVAQGDGPAVLALHGAMGAWDQSAILAAALLPAGMRVIAPSRPGFPGTPLLGASDPAAQADRMLALLDALDVGTTAILAISGGGPCAVEMALRQPDRCRTLLLASTVAGPNPVVIPRRFAVLKAMAAVPGLPGLLSRLTAAKLDKAAVRAFPDAAMRARVLDDPETRDLYLALTETTFRAMAVRIRASENDFHVTATEHYPLEALRVPVLILHGDEDPFVDFERNARAAERRIPGARLERLEGGGHAAIFTHRDQARRAVAAFLTGSAGR